MSRPRGVNERPYESEHRLNPFHRRESRGPEQALLAKTVHRADGHRQASCRDPRQIARSTALRWGPLPRVRVWRRDRLRGDIPGDDSDPLGSGGVILHRISHVRSREVAARTWGGSGEGQDVRVSSRW